MKQTKKFFQKNLVFRKWSNKKYAVFNSINRTVKIACLSVVYLKVATLSLNASIVDTSSVVREYQIESIDVNSEQLPDTYSSLSRVVVTITKSEIQRAAVSSVNELLEYVSSVDIRQRGVGGPQADVSIRGSSFDQVLILLNGINITDPQTGHHNLNLPIDISAIERIEILKGPGAWKFGTGAFSGAINFITKNPEQNSLKLATQIGQFGFHSEDIEANLVFNNLSNLLSVNNYSSNGYIDNTDFRIMNAFYQGNLNYDFSKAKLQLGYTQKAFGANSFYSPKYPNQFETTQTFFSSLSFETEFDKIKVEPSAYYRRGNDNFLLFRDNPSLYSNFHTTDVWGTGFIVTFLDSWYGTTITGVNTRTESIWSNNLGKISDNPVTSPMNDTIILNYHHSRTDLAFFLGHRLYLQNFTLNAGINFSRNTDFNFKWFIYPGIDLSYKLSDKSVLMASVNRSMRLPTFTDMYYKGPMNNGNQNLLPEEITGYDIGYQYSGSFVKTQTSIFYSQGANMIDWVKTDLAEKWTTINHTTLNNMGLEFSMVLFLDKIFVNQTILKSLALDYGYINQEKIETNFISNYSLNYLKHKLNIKLEHKIIENLHLNWFLNYQHRNGVYEKFVDKTSVGIENFSPLFLIDIKLAYGINGWNFSVSANNVFDEEYFDYGNIIQPGRWIKLGISKMISFQK
jgi:vitamin B12 transporter